MRNAPYPLEELNRSAPFDVHRAMVLPEWADWNGHMNVGYYVVAFDRGTTPLCQQIGISQEYTIGKIGMYFILECHVNYLHELKVGEEFGISTQILDHDYKRLHLFHEMYKPSDRQVVATNELMLINIDYSSRRSAPWPPWAADRVEIMAAEHSRLPRPKLAGSIIGIPRPR